MRPIPKRLLIHSVLLRRSSCEDRWGKVIEETSEELSYVRMEPSSRIVRDKNNAEIQLSATLFYDCKNSRPKGLEFNVDDIIEFNGQKHQVQVVEPLYDGKRMHHYELGMIRYG